MNKENLNFKDYLLKLGLKACDHIIVHSSFKSISSAFTESTPDEIIRVMQDIITPSGSLIFPTFTYCYKKSNESYEVFDSINSKSKVGLLSEIFRKNEGVIRTSSPTHAFAVWGIIKEDIKNDNSPDSPLGKGSVLEWLTKKGNTFILMLGTDFSSLSYGHYLEIAAEVPWYDYSPWEYLNVLPIGVSNLGEQKLMEIPGCSKSFVNFEKHLLQKKYIVKYSYNHLESYLISVQDLYTFGTKYFNEKYFDLLCPKGECKACDSRRLKFL